MKRFFKTHRGFIIIIAMTVLIIPSYAFFIATLCTCNYMLCAEVIATFFCFVLHLLLHLTLSKHLTKIFKSYH